jgi:hypothetical protein
MKVPKPLLWLIFIVLYLGSLALGLACIYYLSELVVNLIVQIAENAGSVTLGWDVSLARSVMMLLLGIGFLVFFIASAEYHRKNVGQNESWRLFGITYDVEAIILILAYFFA